MLRAAAAGNSVSKHDFSTALPDLRLGLLNVQVDLAGTDVPVVVMVAPAIAPVIVNISRYMATFIFAIRPLTYEAAEPLDVARHMRSKRGQGESRLGAD